MLVGSPHTLTNCVIGHHVIHRKHQAIRDKIKDVRYGCIVVDYWPPKKELHRTRLTVGGNSIFLRRRCRHTYGRPNYSQARHQWYRFNARGNVYVT